MNKYNSSSSKGCVLKFDLEYLNELCELHNEYLLAPHKNRNQKINAVEVSTNDC